MIQPVHGSSPSEPVRNNFGDTPPTPVYNLMLSLWCSFQNGYNTFYPDQYANNPSFFFPFASAVSAFVTYLQNNPTTDAFTQQVYDDLTNTNIGLGGASIASICTAGGSAWTDWDSFFGIIAPQLNVVYSDIAGGGIVIPGNPPSYYQNWFEQEYYVPSPPIAEPTSTPPATLETYYNQLVVLLPKLQNAVPGSSNYISYGNNVAQVLLNIYNTLESASQAGTLDGYGQFLLSQFSIPDSSGTTLISHVNSILGNGGFAGDPSDSQALLSLLYSSAQGGSSLASDFTGWINDMLDQWEFQ